MSTPANPTGQDKNGVSSDSGAAAHYLDLQHRTGAGKTKQGAPDLHWSDRAVIDELRLENITPATEDNLLQDCQKMAENIAKSAKLKTPKVFIADLTTNRNADKRTDYDKALKDNTAVPQAMYNKLSGNIIVTRKLADIMQPDELEAVIAHEMGHQNKDHTLWRDLSLGIAEKAGALATIFFAGKELFLLATAGTFAPAIPLALAAITVATALLGSFLGKAEEYQADAFAVKHTQTADSLISSLGKLERYFEQNRGEITWDMKAKSLLSPILGTHPPSEKRMKHMLEVDKKERIMPRAEREKTNYQTGFAPSF